ncbi:putative FmdB family regulatory protein [Variovorax sp. TBS-050B]|uniref:zinc ribbon domain-containing protein n=1 Tax=Variovorax sp. TBS-050B TaxID=2940551 RepID=UPI0024770995|nr:zinc ribbon domain-containing protein [Variovorax sp. TBS-050B]MDH6594072.1 putative FmdB family regulatory protein [Variovorax sp. TBS-050B]
MPTYDYACGRCGGFEALRPSGLRDEPAVCPDCGAAAPRVLTAAPRLALMASDTRRAMATNERARHEPASSRDYARLRHPAGCGCCSSASGSGRRGATVTAANGAKAAPSRRPWMISH